MGRLRRGENGPFQLPQPYRQARESDPSLLDLAPLAAYRLTDLFAGPWKGAKITIQIGNTQSLGADIAINEGSYEVSGIRTPDGKPAPAVTGSYLNTIVKKAGAWVIATNAGVPSQQPAVK